MMPWGWLLHMYIYAGMWTLWTPGTLASPDIQRHCHGYLFSFTQDSLLDAIQLCLLSRRRNMPTSGSEPGRRVGHYPLICTSSFRSIADCSASNRVPMWLLESAEETLATIVLEVVKCKFAIVTLEFFVPLCRFLEGKCCPCPSLIDFCACPAYRKAGVSHD
jgi:hypothetical protein